MPRITSSGQCFICGETFPKQSMTRHLAKCYPAHHILMGRGKLRPTFRLLVEGQHLPHYWMHIEIPADAPLSNLDQFLRDTWLECCGHLSEFTIEGMRYELNTGGVDGMWTEIFGRGAPPQSMKTPLAKALQPGLKFFHEYDFGTTTHLALKVIAQEQSVMPKNTVEVLARNHPPAFKCEICGAPATSICTQCLYNNEGWVCAEHAPDHKCGDDMMLPVVNSPRMGECGYTG